MRTETDNPTRAILFSDLDNTLIFSHRRRTDAEKVLAERLNGREQAFMTRRTLDFLRASSPALTLVPVTTRTAEQYARIFLFETDLHVERALVCNGGILLENGQVDENWLLETRRLVEDAREPLERARRQLGRLLGEERAMFPNELFLYGVLASVEEARDVAARLEEACSDAQLCVAADSRKVYVIPAAMSKGVAVRRYENRFGAIHPTVCAGDGMLDVPLLEQADYAVSTRRVPHLAGRFRHVDAGVVLSDELCEVLRREVLT